MNDSAFVLHHAFNADRRAGTTSKPSGCRYRGEVSFLSGGEAEERSPGDEVWVKSAREVEGGRAGEEGIPAARQRKSTYVSFRILSEP